MKINKTVSSILLGMALICASQAVFASGLADLSPEDQAKVKNGKQVTTRVSKGVNFPWPEFRFYQRVHAMPEEAAAVFVDYAKHKDYFQSVGITKSALIESKGPAAKISYSLKFPMGMGSDDYTVTNLLQGDLNAKKFQIDWNVVESNNSYTDSHGTAYFEPMDNGNGTIVTYVNFVHPKERSLVNLTWGWIVNGAEKVQKDTASALITQIEKERINDSETLRQQVEKLYKMLGN